MNNTLKNLIDRYRATNRVAFVYPRKKRVAFNGGRQQTYKEAYKYLTEFFNN